MTSALYAVIRVIADPARDEPMNVGALLWSDSAVRFKVDQDAVNEVLRRNRHLTHDALSFIEEHIQTGLSEFAGESEGVESALLALSAFPISISEPRYVALPDRSPSTLDAELDRLMRRLVQPPRTRGGGKPGIRNEVRKQLKQLVQRDLLKENYRLSASRSGSTWSVDYFANSNLNLALDVLSLAVSDGDEIIKRAAAQAFKLQDILSQNRFAYTVICQFAQDERLLEPNHRARLFLEAGGANIETDLDLAIGRIRTMLPLPLEQPSSTPISSIASSRRPPSTVSSGGEPA